MAIAVGYGCARYGSYGDWNHETHHRTLVVVAMSGAAQASSIRTFDADSASFPSLLRVGTAEAPKAEAMKAEAEMPKPAAVDADGNELDGRSQLEAWAMANGTTVSELLTKRLYGHYEEHRRRDRRAGAEEEAPHRPRTPRPTSRRPPR
ncbi:MAG: hypothetical protein H6891_06010 [Brucellaceae bacterium]|nr:hypothetical protein [Brucellaceae bacterium]